MGEMARLLESGFDFAGGRRGLLGDDLVFAKDVVPVVGEGGC